MTTADPSASQPTPAPIDTTAAGLSGRVGDPPEDLVDHIANMIRCHGRNAATVTPWEAIGGGREYYREIARAVLMAASSWGEPE